MQLRNQRRIDERHYADASHNIRLTDAVAYPRARSDEREWELQNVQARRRITGEVDRQLRSRRGEQRPRVDVATGIGGTEARHFVSSRDNPGRHCTNSPDDRLLEMVPKSGLVEAPQVEAVEVRRTPERSL